MTAASVVTSDRGPLGLPRRGEPRERVSGRVRARACVALVGLLLSAALPAAIAPASAGAAVTSSTGQVIQEAGSGEEGVSLESAATKAGETGRNVAMSLIGLAFAVAGVVLAFRRDFKEAAGVFVVGIISVLLVTPAGINLLHDTVNSIFGS